MNDIITMLLMAQRCTKVHHWQTKSFSRHLAFDELYEALNEMTDRLAEESMGDQGQDATARIDQSVKNIFDEKDDLEFIKQLHEALAKAKDSLPDLDWLENTYEELQGQVSRIKYKLENLA